MLTWILSWGGHAAIHQPGRFLDGNIFWPHATSIAYSDPLLPVVPVFALFRALTGSPVVALNLTLLVLVGLSLAATYALARRLTGRADVALFAALAYSFSSFVSVHTVHLQLLTLGLFPLGFLTVLRLLERPTARRGLAAGIVAGAMATGALYYAAIYVVCVSVVIVLRILAQSSRGGRHRGAGRVSVKPRSGWWKGWAVAGVVAAAISLPVVVPYARLQHQLPARERVDAFGFNPVDLLAPAPGSYVYGPLARAAQDRPAPFEHAAFLGISTLLLAAWGGVVLWRTRPPSRRLAMRPRRDGSGSDWSLRIKPPSGASPQPDPNERARRRELVEVVAAGAVAAVLAAGGTVGGVPGPFRLFFDHAPGFGAIRAVSRLVVPGLLALCLLAAVGLKALIRRIPSRLAPLVAFAAAAVVLVELAAPFPHQRIDRSAPQTAVDFELRRRPDGAVVELPAVDPEDPTRGLLWANLEAPRMALSTIDWHPRFNGYSGYAPVGYAQDVRILDGFPDTAALDRMRELRLRYVVLHVGGIHGIPQYSDGEVEAIVAALPIGATATRYGNAWLVDLADSKFGSAGINRHGEGDENALHRRSSDPRWP